MTDSGFWYFAPMNALYLTVFALFILLLVVASLIVRRCSEKTRRTVLATACLLTIALFFFYKYSLSIDADYHVITADKGGFNWWGELPLYLCNINMIIIPIAVWRKSRPLMSFSFFLAPLGALMALLMPGNGFSGYSLLLPRMIGFFGTHFMIFIEGLALATFGLYRPRFSDLPKMVLTLMAVAAGVFLFNIVLRRTGLHEKANYFYIMETEGNPVLDIFHSWIPLPFLYMLPSLLILLPYASLITLGFHLSDKVREKKAGEAA